MTSPEAVRQILVAAEPRLRPFVGLGEATAQQVTDVDFLRREIRLPKHKCERTIHAAQALIDTFVISTRPPRVGSGTRPRGSLPRSSALVRAL